MPYARINCWTAAYEVDKLQIELVVNCLANMLGKTDGSMQLACLKPSRVREFRDCISRFMLHFSGFTYPFTVGLSVRGKRGEHLVLVNCLIKPDLGKNQNSQFVLQQNTSLLLKYNSIFFYKIKLPIVLEMKPSRLLLK